MPKSQQHIDAHCENGLPQSAVSGSSVVSVSYHPMASNSQEQKRPSKTDRTIAWKSCRIRSLVFDGVFCSPRQFLHWSTENGTNAELLLHTAQNIIAVPRSGSVVRAHCLRTSTVFHASFIPSACMKHPKEAAAAIPRRATRLHNIPAWTTRFAREIFLLVLVYNVWGVVSAFSVRQHVGVWLWRKQDGDTVNV